MAIAEEQQCPRVIDWQVDGGAAHEAVVIHIAPEASQIECAVRLFAGRRRTNAAQHRHNRHCITGQRRRGMRQSGDVLLQIEAPFVVELRIVLNAPCPARIHRMGIDPAAAARAVAVGPEAVNLHGQGVAGQSSFHIEWPGLGIASRRLPD